MSAQAAIHLPGGRLQRLADLGDVERDAIENEEVARLNRAAGPPRWAGSWRRPVLSSAATRSNSGLNASKSSQGLRLAISSAARLSALVRTWRSTVMSSALGCVRQLGGQFVIVDGLVAARQRRSARRQADPDGPAAQAARGIPEARAGGRGARHKAARRCRGLRRAAARGRAARRSAGFPRSRR